MAIAKNFSLESVEHGLWLRNLKYQYYHLRKSLSDRRFSVTVEDLCKYCGISIESLSPAVKRIAHKRVKQISAVQPDFMKGGICVQMYDDTEDDMRWAMRNGALAIVTEMQIDDLPCIVTKSPSPPMIYAKMCRYYRDLRNIPVTAVTGSIGKTTVKRMINSVYEEHFNCFCNTINYNALYHAGYYVQHIPKEAQVMIQEVSEDTPGYVEPMSILLSPSIAVITTIDKSHYEAFGSDENIGKEVCSIVKGMGDDGTVIVNADDFSLYHLLEGKRVVKVSAKDKESDFYADNIELGKDGLIFDVVNRRKTSRHKVRLDNIYARHNVGCSLLAFAAGAVSGIPEEEIVKGLEGFQMLGMRQNIFQTEEGIKVYADCFNAVPLSIRTAVAAICEMPVDGKRIAVLGDIAETGELARSIHSEIVDIVADSKIDILLSYGENINAAIDAHRALLQTITVIKCDSHNDIISNLKKIMKKGDIVLFKASHSAELRRCIQAIWPTTYAKVNSDEREPYNKWIMMVRKK